MIETDSFNFLPFYLFNYFCSFCLFSTILINEGETIKKH
jgi:hypothetical protein